MQDSSNENPRPATPQPEIPPYEALQPGTPQQGTPPAGTTSYETPRQASPRLDRPHRPIGVTILSILIGLEGLAELFIGILAIGALMALGHAFSAHGHTHLAAAFDVIGWILGILPLVIGAITLAVAIGLFLLKRWAYWTTVVVSVIFLIRQVYELIQPRDTYTLVIMGTIIPVVILLYLLADPHVRRAFRVGGRSNVERVAGT